jgi:hypothetical protein
MMIFVAILAIPVVLIVVGIALFDWMTEPMRKHKEQERLENIKHGLPPDYKG